MAVALAVAMAMAKAQTCFVFLFFVCGGYMFSVNLKNNGLSDLVSLVVLYAQHKTKQSNLKYWKSTKPTKK